MKQELELIENLHALHLPKKLIFLDVNGTLIGDNSNGMIERAALKELVDVATDLHSVGYEIGLASDSPAAKLVFLSRQLGIAGPILAENGNIILYKGLTLIVRSLNNLDILKHTIRKVLSYTLFKEVADQSPLKFSGNHVNSPAYEWAFGAGRETSITLHAPADAVDLVYREIKDKEDISVDSDASNGFLAVHPLGWKINKMETIKMIKEVVPRVVMIGDSVSDWSDSLSGLECGFVGNATIDSSVRERCTYISKKEYSHGVVDILQKIHNNLPGRLDTVKALTDGEINRTFLVEYESEQAVLQFLNQYTDAELEGLSPYFHPQKIDKVFELTSLLLRYNIPVPEVIEKNLAGPRPWILTKYVKGVGLSSYFETLSSSQRIKVVKGMAAQLAKVHGIPRDSLDTVASLKLTDLDHLRLVHKMVKVLKSRGILAGDTCSQVIKWHEKNIPIASYSAVGLVHRDYFQRNIFIDPSSLDITGIIDWGDTAHIGDTAKDALLAARWIASGLPSHESESIFWCFLKEYNDLSVTKIELHKASQYLDVYMLEWYLEAALLTHYIGNKAQVLKQTSRIKKMVKG